MLIEAGLSRDRWQPLWSSFDDEYYLRHRAEEVAWHTEVLIRDPEPKNLIVDANNSIADGLTVLMVYANRSRRSFVRTTATLDDLGLNVVDARIIPVTEDRHLNTYCVLDAAGQQIADGAPLDELKARIVRSLQASESQPIKVNRRTPRQVRVFSTPVQITITQDPANERTVIELVASDRPGLLYQVGQVFENVGVSLQNAKVATIGERAEDVFFVTTDDNAPLDDALCSALAAALQKALSDNGSS
jgi:[protein-PII] uridylyltransferase